MDDRVLRWNGWLCFGPVCEVFLCVGTNVSTLQYSTGALLDETVLC